MLVLIIKTKTFSNRSWTVSSLNSLRSCAWTIRVNGCCVGTLGGRDDKLYRRAISNYFMLFITIIEYTQSTPSKSTCSAAASITLDEFKLFIVLLALVPRGAWSLIFWMAAIALRYWISVTPAGDAISERSNNYMTTCVKRWLLIDTFPSFWRHRIRISQKTKITIYKKGYTSLAIFLCSRVFADR